MSTSGFLLVMCEIFGDQDRIYFTLFLYHQNRVSLFQEDRLRVDSSLIPTVKPDGGSTFVISDSP